MIKKPQSNLVINISGITDTDNIDIKYVEKSTSGINKKAIGYGYKKTAVNKITIEFKF